MERKKQIQKTVKICKKEKKKKIIYISLDMVNIVLKKKQNMSECVYTVYLNSQ